MMLSKKDDLIYELKLFGNKYLLIYLKGELFTINLAKNPYE